MVISELVVPGLVIVFAGIAAIGVGLLRLLGLLESVPASVVAWMVLSAVMILTLRSAVRRWIPAEEEVSDIDERTLNYGEVVTVEEDVAEASDGQIRFKGSLWRARSAHGPIPAGSKARLVYQDGLTWVIEAVSEEEAEVVDEPGAKALPAKGEAGLAKVPEDVPEREAT